MSDYDEEMRRNMERRRIEHQAREHAREQAETAERERIRLENLEAELERQARARRMQEIVDARRQAEKDKDK